MDEITTLPYKLLDTDPKFYQVDLKELTQKYNVQLITKGNERYYLISSKSE